MDAMLNEDVKKDLNKEEEALAAMEHELPKYVVESFVCSGYDTLPVIAKMNNDTIGEIEQFITDEFREDARFAQGINSKCVFKFLPGHRHRITDFISAVKLRLAQEQTTLILKRKRECDKSSSWPTLKKHEGSDVHPEEELLSNGPDQKKAMESIRKQVVKWQRGMSSPKIKALEEVKDFEIKINLSRNNSKLCPYMVCKLCDHKFALGFKDKKVIISNWSRHIINCVEKRKESISKINNFFQVPKHAGKQISPDKPVLLNVDTSQGSSASALEDNVLLQSELNVAAKQGTVLVPPIASILEDNALQQPSFNTAINQSSSASAVEDSTHLQSQLNIPAKKGTILVPPSTSTQEDNTLLQSSFNIATNQGSSASATEDNAHAHPQSQLNVVAKQDTTSVPYSACAIQSKEKKALLSITTTTNGNQVFRLSPPASRKQEGEIMCKPKIDWSRSSRKYLSLLKAGSDPNQLKITSYFEDVDSVTDCIQSTPQLQEFLRMESTITGTYCSIDNFNSMLKRLILNAENNASRAHQGRRHDAIVKKFATSLFIFSGPLAYNFLQQNLPLSLPCLRSIQRSVSQEYTQTNEGEFRFDGLLNHITEYKAPKIVSIGEDATRIISKVQYDCNTNKMVGFVLPCDDLGLPLTDTFLAISFEQMEQCFTDSEIARNCFVYMAQPLAENVPAFCLACMGINNKHDNTLVMKRWSHIVSECAKRKIAVVSFGADGDSRELKAMLQSAHLSHGEGTVPDALNVNKLCVPKEWLSWFAIKDPNGIAYVQDTVHIAVKLKARLLNPSVDLVFGGYIAGSHHLHAIIESFGKDEHGMRIKDVNHKDRQNYDAVIHITSDSVQKILSAIPDAKGTLAYLRLIRCVIDSYLDKNLDITARIKKAWYAAFFVRYWRQWLLINPQYSLADNFISLNAYKCIELNAHSIILYAMIIRELFPSHKESFIPWLLGSQSCEKMFRAARSMSSTFSTIINFDMLGFLQRIHRLHIQYCLENEAQTSGIKYPHKESHKAKDGHHKCSVNSEAPTNKQILDAVNAAIEEARNNIDHLGMLELLKTNDYHKNPPMPDIFGSKSSGEDNNDNEDYDDEECDYDDTENTDNDQPVCNNSLVQSDPKMIADDIILMEGAGIINKELSENLKQLHNITFKRIKNSALPLFDAVEQISDKSKERKSEKGKHCYYVEVLAGDKSKPVYINKTTIVWLLQEGERVSADRLFRVRNKQPFSSCDVGYRDYNLQNEINPVVCKTISVSNICIFKFSPTNWKIGKIQNFSYFKEKTKTGRQYPKKTYNFDDNIKKPVGVMCSWYTMLESPAKFEVDEKSTVHEYVPMHSYLCTLTYKCFETQEDGLNFSSDSVTNVDLQKRNLATAKSLTLTPNTLSQIEKLILASTSNDPPVNQTGMPSCKPDRDAWVKHGGILLTKKEKHEILNKKELSDMHINAFQNLMKRSYPHISGLQNTLLQNTAMNCKLPRETSMVLQIIHIKTSPRSGHWAALQIFENDEVHLYDSAYTSAVGDSKETIAKLIHSEKDYIKINIMNVSKQRGTVDCGLYAIATIVGLAQGNSDNIIGNIFHQDEMRPHLIKILESGNVLPFPAAKKRRVQDKILQVELCQIYCSCRLPDTGSTMICCDHCDKWYHSSCVGMPVTSQEWYCDECHMHTTGD